MSRILAQLPLWLQARLLLQLGVRELGRSHRYSRSADAAAERADARMAEARAIADRLRRLRQAETRVPPGDLLHGSRAIAAHLGVPKSVAVHLIRSRLIPCFALGGVACARRSSLAAHFQALEAKRQP